jgi:Fuc2NAc and GlcNAc transferase
MFLAAVVTSVVAAVLTPLLAAWAHRRELLDVPNHRSSHVVATPRIGGVGLVVSVVGGLAVLHLAGAGLGRDAYVVVAGAVCLAAVGLADDLWTLPALVRLVMQATIAALVVMRIGPADLPWLAADGVAASILTIFWIVAVTNAYNFMDGIDGIAGAQALVGGMGWTVVGLLAGSAALAALGLMLAAASGGFLLHNWHPAKVFMGDAGSGFFGFLFAALPLLAPPGRVSVVWCAVLLMWPFLFDTGFTLLRRASRGENVLSAHRSHLYQRLILTGRSHAQVALLYGGLALLGAVAAVAVEAGPPVASPVSLVAIVLAALVLWWMLTSREAALLRRASGGATA